MPKFGSLTIARWADAATEWLERNTPAPHYTLADVRVGRDAWRVAHGAGICREAYAAGREVTDAHIVTALKRIFPNATFTDSYRY